MCQVLISLLMAATDLCDPQAKNSVKTSGLLPNTFLICSFQNPNFFFRLFVTWGNPHWQTSHAHHSQIALPGDGPGFLSGVQFCRKVPQTPDVWEFTLYLTQKEGLVRDYWAIQNCFSYLFDSNAMLKLAVLWIPLCVAAGSFLDILFSLSESCTLDQFFVLFISVTSIWMLFLPLSPMN